MDKVGDAFTDQANSMRPMNVGQRREQALMRGLGAGFGLNPAREAKLAELENMSKEASFAKINLEKEAATNQLKEEKLKSFVADYDADLQMASNLIVQGKYDQLDILAPRLISGYEEKTGKKLGQYLFSKNGHSAFKQENGQINTIPIKDLLNPVMNAIPPENRGSYKGFATTYQAQELDAIVETRKLQQDQIRASTEASRASAALHKSQAEKAKMEAQNPMSKKEQETILKTNITSNRKYIEEKLDPKLEASENILTAYDRLGKIAIETPNLVGSDYLTKVRRTLGEAFGLDPNLDYAKLSNVDFEKMLKPILGAQFAKDEGNRILAKLPSIEKNRKALLQFLKEDRPKLIKSIVKMKAAKNAYNKNNAINILDESQLGDTNNDYNMFIKGRYGVGQNGSELIVDTNSNEYNMYKNKGAIGK
jgi:hypothetical protein